MKRITYLLMFCLFAAPSCDLLNRPVYNNIEYSTFYKNEKVDRLLDEAIAEPDKAKRAKLYEEVQSTIWNDAPWAFLVTEDVTGASVKTLKNFRLRPDSSYDFYEAEIVK